MKVFHSLSELAPLPPTVATIGNFDGVHRGHCWVIDQVNTRARALSLGSLAITFEPHPSRVLRPEVPFSLITPLQQKLDLLSATRIDATLVLPFTRELAQLSAEDFARRILCDACHIREIHEGETFRFGHQAEADINSLKTLGERLNFTVQTDAPYLLRGAPVSSSRIRALISEGEVSQARALLGRPFAIRSTPASGRGYGTRYAVPTINLAPYPELVPANGVYVTTLTIAGECFESVTNVGNRPTFGVDSFAIESHILNFHPIDLTEQTPLELAFLHRLRPEIRFPSTEALRTQIGLDVAKARRLFQLTKSF